MDITEPAEIAPEPPPLCPPSVPQQMWDMIPAVHRREALEFAAVSLRKAIHPEHAVASFLTRLGIAPPTPVEPPRTSPVFQPRPRPAS